MPKGLKTNPYALYMNFRRRELEKEGKSFPGGWKEVADLIDKEWKEMSNSEKDSWKNQSRDMKLSGVRFVPFKPQGRGRGQGQRWNRSGVPDQDRKSDTVSRKRGLNDVDDVTTHESEESSSSSKRVCLSEDLECYNLSDLFG